MPCKILYSLGVGKECSTLHVEFIEQPVKDYQLHQCHVQYLIAASTSQYVGSNKLVAVATTELHSAAH